MNLRIPGMFGLGIAILPACGNTGGAIVADTAPIPSGGTEVFAVTTTWTDGDGVTCSDSVRIQVVDPLGVEDWDFGMRRDDHTAEDCLSGLGGTGVCHPIGIDHTLNQVPDCLASSVVPGSTTFFDAASQPTTYYLADRVSCFVWGADVAYYAVLGCDTLM